MNGALSCSRPPQVCPKPRSCLISLISTLSSKQQYLSIQMYVPDPILKYSSSLCVSDMLQPCCALMTLCFHLPFCTLNDQQCTDSRQDREGRPLRKSLALPCMKLPCTIESSLDGWICDAQVSVLVSVVDVCGWTAYMFEDTYHKACEPAKELDIFCSKPGFYFPDALTAGALDSTRLIGPREYFVKVLRIRIDQVFREWQLVVDRLEEIVKW